MTFCKAVKCIKIRLTIIFIDNTFEHRLYGQRMLESAKFVHLSLIFPKYITMISFVNEIPIKCHSFPPETALKYECIARLSFDTFSKYSLRDMNAML